jgi:hypothetical protein
MSSCQGELPEMKFALTATDQSGNVLVNETVTTLKNGFFELWLPRNRSIKLTVQGAERQAVSSIATFDGSNTCITNLQLR